MIRLFSLTDFVAYILVKGIITTKPAMLNIAQTVDKMVPGAMHPEPF